MSIGSLPLGAISAAREVSKKQKLQEIPPTIEQTERLFTTRSRSISHMSGGGDRGQHTYVQLLTHRKTGHVQGHHAEGLSKPTSLGSDTSGPLADAIAGKYGKFLLTDIHAGFDEKLQISEVFGDAEVVYYFGRHPVNVQFQGMLIDSPDNNWFIEWIEMYAHVFRGTELARNYELVKVITPNMTFIGTFTNMSWNQNSQRDVDIPFQFNMLVKQIIPNAVMIPGKPTNVVVNMDASKVEKFRTQSEIVSAKSAVANLMNTIKDPFATVSQLAGAMSLGGGPLSSGMNVMSGLNQVFGYL